MNNVHSVERQEIYDQLIELTPWLQRRECVARNMVDMDILLDRLNEITRGEDEMEKRFGEVFGGGDGTL